MIVIIDYGVGNLFSLKSSLDSIGAETVISGDIDVIKKASKIILPGVGAFCDAVKKLKDSSLFDLIIEEANNKKPILGICLGMQMLFEKSFENGEYEGLGLIKGEVRPIKEIIPEDYKVPQIGWNYLKFNNEKHPLFKYIKEEDYVYFVHSYYGAFCDSVIAYTEYGAPITAAVAKDNVMGCQFHPEKSGDVGLNILKAFCEWEV
ncbi:MAG: imidazole glycerol phosphate synthase subunit HisH [Ruminococcaceae bacterium]|nr:imidazole glycerol phosphate synthase subunit HisH [Oscillospiraceae bacterium]